MIIESPAFKKNELIPSQYGCDKEGIHPPLLFSDIPNETKSLALIVEDPDTNGNWVIWLLWNVAPDVAGINEGYIPAGTTEGRNSWGRIGYGAICPTHPMNIHHIVFWLLAVDTILDLPSGSTKAHLEKALKSHILARAHLTGIFRR